MPGALILLFLSLLETPRRKRKRGGAVYGPDAWDQAQGDGEAELSNTESRETAASVAMASAAVQD
jgi:hypothetical protein